MNCPGCGATMNRHAEKAVWPRTPAETAALDPGLDGALVEVHACPVCGLLAERLLTPPRHL